MRQCPLTPAIVVGSLLLLLATVRADERPADHVPDLPEAVARALRGATVYSRDNTPDCDKYYPKEAKDAGIEGTTLLYVGITKDGRAVKAIVIKSSGSDVLDVKSAGCAIRKGKFVPPRVDGKPSAVWVKMKWTWKLTA